MFVHMYEFDLYMYIFWKKIFMRMYRKYRMRGNVCGTKFSRFSRTAWASAKVESTNYCGTRDYVMIIKWPSRCAMHMLTLQNTTTIDRTKGAIGFVLVQIKLRLKCFYSS